MKTAILVCALTAAALAAPTYKRPTRLDPKVSEHVKAAEHAWDVAEREADPAKQTARWEQAAAAFAEVDGDPIEAKLKREAAYAAVLAWKNALNRDPRVKPNDVPVKQVLPPREVKMLAALDRYVAYADPKDPELPGLLFLKASTHRRFDQLDVAIPMFRAIVERFPAHEVAGFAAQLALDSYNRLDKYDELIKLADELAKNTTLLKTSPDLADLVRRIQHQAGRKRVDLLGATARADKDPEMHVAAGAGYLELYNAAPRKPDGDELLYNAGISFGLGLAYDDAIQAFTLLQRTYPNSKHTARMLGRWSQLYARRAMYDKAAELLEQYATRYAGEKDAYQAMGDAVFYRKALGDREKAIADTNFFIKNFGAKKPREVADAMWSLTALYESEPDRAIAHLREYLRSYGTKGGADRVTIAHAKIGQLLWKQSCAVPGVDGLCVKANERTKVTCGAGTTRTSITVARDARKAKLALASFATAIREYERRPAEDPAARYFYAQAKLATADADLEAYLALAVPRDLDFEGANQLASRKRFSEWLDQKKKTGGAVTRQYEAILMTKDTVGSITAAARLGTLTESFASSLLTTELGVRSAAKRDAYCDVMTDVVAPLEARAVEAFAVCLAKSTELGYFGESSRSCERALLYLKPAEFPAARELHAKPTLTAPVIDLEPPP